VLFPPDNPPPAVPPRVVITGAGIVSALGVGWRENAAGFRVGRTAFRPVSLFDVSRQRVRTAAEVTLPKRLPATRLTARQVARLDRAGAMLLIAAHEGWTQSGWEPGDDLPLILGTTAGGMSLGEAYFRRAVQEPRRHRHQPTRALHYQAHTQARTLGNALGFSGPTCILSNACAAGANAIGHAWELIRRGQAERALAGGQDALSQMVFSGFDSLQTLSPTVCRPFDARRDGLSLGEGAAILALETLDRARRRGAVILGELIGYGTAIDAHHLTQPHPQGDAALAAMTLACQSAGVTPADVGYLNAHGTGTPLNDSAEAAAINRWAGPRAPTLPVSSTKAGIGHLLGAAGAVEAVICLMALREQWLPPETTIETPDPACNFPIVRKPQDARVDVVLSNSFGFGGVNASLLLRRWA
jgi:3-oxoacyl-[acyl-carrier-protein] synthase II